MDVTAGIGMVWVHLRHLSLQNTSMHATVRRGEVMIGEGHRDSALVSLIPSHEDQLICEDSHYPVYFRQTEFHLFSVFLSFPLKQLSGGSVARYIQAQ